MLESALPTQACHRRDLDLADVDRAPGQGIDGYHDRICTRTTRVFDRETITNPFYLGLGADKRELMPMDIVELRTIYASRKTGRNQLVAGATGKA